MDPSPAPICLRCSKPVHPGTASQLAGRVIHFRCLVRETQLDSIAQEDRASRERRRTLDLSRRASALVQEARALRSICPVCRQKLANRGSVLYQGEQLVHGSLLATRRVVGR